MSKEGSLKRIAKYKRHNNLKLLAQEEEFYKANYAETTPTPKAKKVDKLVKE